MKKLICIFFCLLILTAPAFAVQYLQVDAADDMGVKYSDGVITPESHDFTLYAFVDLKNNQTIENTLVNPTNNEGPLTFYISMALIPKFPEQLESEFNYGTFLFNGNPYDVTSEKLGDLRYDSNLPTVDSDTLYFEYSFTFDDTSITSGTIDEYTTIENTNELGGPVDFVLDDPTNLKGSMAYAAFEFDMSTLEKFDVRFDLYTLDSNGKIQRSASESHYVQTAPEPGTMLLFGFGLIWMARMGRKKLL